MFLGTREMHSRMPATLLDHSGSHLEAIWKPSKPLRRPRCLRPSPRRHPWAPLPGKGRQLRAPARCSLTTSLLGPLALRPDSVSPSGILDPRVGDQSAACAVGADVPGPCHRLARLCQRRRMPLNGVGRGGARAAQLTSAIFVES